jgi:predicted Holliday junction resolvase-like endonuclease
MVASPFLNFPQGFWILFIVLFFAGLIVGIYAGKALARYKAEREFELRLPIERDDAIKRSRAVIAGQVSEQLAPFLPGFPFDPTEIRFIGKPVDFIAFVGAASGNIDEVVFVEVKSGNASLSGVEKTLKLAIEKRSVRWVEYRVPKS